MSLIEALVLVASGRSVAMSDWERTSVIVVETGTSSRIASAVEALPKPGPKTAMMLSAAPPPGPANNSMNAVV